MKVVVILPAFQESSRIANVVLAVRPFVSHVVVVDDGSSDYTSETARQAGAVVLKHVVNRGQGAALKTGTEAALRLGADILVHMDADGQHGADSIGALIAPIQVGLADVVFGSRFLGVEPEGMPLARRWILSLARLFNIFVLGVPRRITDPQSGFRALSAEAARRINFQQDQFAHCSEILRLVTRSGLRYQEIPTRIRYTQESLTKTKRPDVFKIVWQLFIGSFRG